MSPLAELRRSAIGSSLRRHAALGAAVEHLAYVQIDPIRAPARAQDLILRPRVEGYRNGDLAAAYPALPLEEDRYVNYGYLRRDVQQALHPRPARERGDDRTLMDAIAEFVSERGPVGVDDVAAAFDHGSVTNAWGGSSAASTRALETLHRDGLLRVVGRDRRGAKIYGAAEPIEQPPDPVEAAALLVDTIIAQLAPINTRTLAASLFTYSARHLSLPIKATIAQRKAEGPTLTVDGETYLLGRDAPTADEGVTILAPFDPIVWCRRRFEHLWGWPYRLEAYTPAPKRQFGYYALPIRWNDAVVGWMNWNSGSLDFGAPSGALPKSRAFKAALADELERFRAFL